MAKMKFEQIAIIAGLLLFTTPAVTQQAIDPGKEFNFKLTGADVQTVWDALADQPFKKSAPVLNKLQVQFNMQQASPMQVVKPEEPKKE